MAQSDRSNDSSSPRVALITGASRRIGRASAVRLAELGWRIGVHYRNSQDDAMSLVDEIVDLGSQGVALRADLGRKDDVYGLIGACAETLGPPTCLVNNASEFLHDSISEMTDEIWDTHLTVNLKAPVFLARDLARRLPPGVQGNVINIIDQRVWKLTPEFFSYTVSKSGLWSATRMLGQALAPRVRVNAIGPGPVIKSVHQSAEDFVAESKSTLLGHGPKPGEIAEAIRFILETPSITGQMIALDGGQHLTWQP